MNNPFKKIGDAVVDKAEDLEDRIEHRVEVKLCRLAVSWNLSRLKDIDPDNAFKYDQMEELLKTL